MGAEESGGKRGKTGKVVVGVVAVVAVAVAHAGDLAVKYKCQIG
jgi:hypothetical protein